MEKIFKSYEKFIISLFFAICLITLPIVKLIDWLYQLNLPAFLHYSQDALLGFYGQFLCFIGALLLGILIYVNDKKKEKNKICSDNSIVALELKNIYFLINQEVYSDETLTKLKNINEKIITQFNLI